MDRLGGSKRKAVGALVGLPAVTPTYLRLRLCLLIGFEFGWRSRARLGSRLADCWEKAVCWPIDRPACVTGHTRNTC